eukprot:433329_1
MMILHGNTKDRNMDELIWQPSCYGGPCVEIPFKSTVCYECRCDDFYTNDISNNIYARDCDHEEAVYNSPDTLQSIRCPETTPMPTPAPTGGCLMHQENIFLFGMQEIVIHIVIVIQQMV